MQQEIRQVVPERIELPDPVVEEERKPGQGHVMPLRRREHPLQVARRKMRVSHEVFVVVPVDEFARQRRPETRKDDENQEGGDPPPKAGLKKVLQGCVMI